MAGGILRRIGVAFGVDVDDKEARSGIESLKSFATKTLGTIAVGVSLVKVNALAEEFGTVNKIIKNATRELADQTGVQNKILEAANLTKSAYADTAKVVTALVQENKELFGNIDEAIKFNNAATELFKSAGKTDEQIAGLMEAINKSFAKGKVDSETVSQLLEQSPEAVDLLEKKLGATKDSFEQMASDGRISLKDLKEAFTDSADEIEKRFLESGTNINDALKSIKNEWGLYVAQVWNGAGVSRRAGKMMVRAFGDFMSALRKGQPTITKVLMSAMNWLQRVSDGISRIGSFLGRLVEHVGGVENAIKLLLIVAGTLWIAFNFQKIIDGLLTLKKIFLGVFDPKNLKIMALVGAIVLIILAIEDFINFLQGNESVIGLFFDKIGIGSDNARQAILDAFGKAKNFIRDTIETVRSIIKTAFDAIKTAIDRGREAISSFVDGIQNTAKYLKDHKEAIELLGVAIGTVTALIVAYNAASIAAAASSGAETAAILGMYAADKIAAVAKGALTAATTIWTTACGIATGVTTGLGAAIAFLTSPIGLVILAIGALIAAGILLYNHWDEVKAWGKSLWDSISGAFLAGVEKVKGFIADVIAFVENNWPALLLLLVNPIAGAFALLYNNCEEFRNFINSFLENVKALWNNAWNFIKNFFVSIWDAMVGRTKEKIDTVKTTIEAGLNAAADFVKGLPKEALKWGTDIIDGIATGIRNAAGRVVDEVKGVANKIKSFLHFSRPDEGPLVDYETWMPDFIDGLSKTLRSRKSKLTDAVLDVSSALNITPTIRTTANAFGGGRSGNTVNQKVEINNTVKTEDSKAGRAAAKQLDRSSKDVTNQIAKGLAYGRA